MSLFCIGLSGVAPLLEYQWRGLSGQFVRTIGDIERFGGGHARVSRADGEEEFLS